jgi:hypothetical protein
MSAGDGLSFGIGVEFGGLILVAAISLACTPVLRAAHQLARALVLAIRSPLRRRLGFVLSWPVTRRLRRFGTLAKTEAALQHFHIPIGDRAALRNKLLEHELLYGVSLGILAPVPFFLLWRLHQDLDQLRNPGAELTLQALVVAFSSLLLAMLAIFGGMWRFAAPRVELLSIKALCRALITAHRVSEGHWWATRKQLSEKAEEVGRFLEGSARYTSRKWRRPALTAHAELVHTVLRDMERELDVVGDAAVSNLAVKLARVLRGLCAETPESLLDAADLPARPTAVEPSKRRVAALLLVGLLLVVIVSSGAAALGVPGAVGTPVVAAIVLIPLYLWGGPGFLRAQRLLQVLTASSDDQSATPAPPEPSANSNSTPTS